MDLVDAISCSQRVSSPVAVSEQEAVFRRKFSSVYDVLRHAVFDEADMRQVLLAHLPADCDQPGGYEVYVVDATFMERAAAKTLPDRRCMRIGVEAAVQYGHKYSWLVRMVSEGTSWVAPLDVERITSDEKDTQVARRQVQRLGAVSTLEKVLLGDGSYGTAKFLSVFLETPHLHGIVRVRGTRNLYEAPPSETQPRRGRRRKHGAVFKLHAPSRPPDQHREQILADQRRLKVSVWRRLHFRELASLEGSILRLELLRPDGQACYKRPTFVFWTGDPQADPLWIARLYLWRFGIEHAFRFFKQQLGLNRCRSTHLPSLNRWIWCCILAYWQLLLMRQSPNLDRPAWYPQRKTHAQAVTTPRLVQRNASRILVELGSPARTPKPSGKGAGRLFGYHPPPRMVYPTVLTKRQKVAAASGLPG